MSENNSMVPEVVSPVHSNGSLSVFLDKNAFEQLYRAAKLFASSDLVPTSYKGKEANCFIALELSSRMGVPAFAVMQNVAIINGKPGMEAKLIIAMINNSNLFTDPLDYEVVGDDPSWNKKDGKPADANYKVRAFATRRKTGKTCYGPWITWDMAIAEGWVSKGGSKWQTMAGIMFQYRAASFFGKLYCPDLMFGMSTTEELQDITPYNGAADASIPTSKTNILNSIGAGESILPAATETVVAPTAEEPIPSQPVQAAKESAPAPVSDTAAAEEVIPSDKLTFMYLDELSRLTGETQDDLIDTHSKNKFGCLADLMGALGDKTKLTMAYLNDVLVPALKAKAAEVAEEQQEG